MMLLAPDPHRVRRPGKSFYPHGTSQRILTDKTRFYDCAKQQDVTSLKFYFILFFTQQNLPFLDYNSVIDYIVSEETIRKSGAYGGQGNYRRFDGKDFSFLLEENFR